MAVTPKAYRTNVIRDSTVTLTSLAEQGSFPGIWLKDQLRSKKTRSAVGWTVGPGFNSAFPFDGSDGKRLAYIASGTYATGAAYATAVQTAINNSGYHGKALANFTAEWRADRSTLDANGLVSSAANMEGTAGRDMSQGTAGQRPLWVANALGTGRPAWYFNGTNQSLVCAANLSALAGASGILMMKVEFCMDSDCVAGAMLLWAASGADVVDLSWTNTTIFRARATDATSTKVASKTATNGVSSIGMAILRFDLTNLSAGAFNSDSASLQNTAMTAAIKASVLATPLHIGSDGTNHFKGYIFGAQVYNAGITSHNRLAMTSKQRYAGLVDGAGAPVWGDVWGVSYDSTAKKFSVTHTSGAGTITLPAAAQPAWLNGEDFNERAYQDLGITTDRTAVATALADVVAYQSRQWWKAYIGTSFGATLITFAQLLDHNISATGSVTMKNAAIDMFHAISGVASQALSTISADAAMLFATFTGVANNYWRIEINDVQNPNGYVEVGKWQLGLADVAPTVQYESDFLPYYDDLSLPQYGPYGALHNDERPQRKVWELHWPLLVTTDYNAFVTFYQKTTIGRCFVFAFDTTGDPTNFKYVELAAPLEIAHVDKSRDAWSVKMRIREALG